MSAFNTMCETLEKEIEESYLEGVTADKAEKLAGQFLHAQLRVSAELRKADLDSRMRKSGLKALRAGVYTDVCTKNEKKPTEAGIAAIIDCHEVVQAEQDRFDNAEVSRDDLERYYNIFQAAHVHFRTIAKGQFGG